MAKNSFVAEVTFNMSETKINCFFICLTTLKNLALSVKKMINRKKQVKHLRQRKRSSIELL